MSPPSIKRSLLYDKGSSPLLLSAMCLYPCCIESSGAHVLFRPYHQQPDRLNQLLENSLHVVTTKPKRKRVVVYHSTAAGPHIYRVCGVVSQKNSHKEAGKVNVLEIPEKLLPLLLLSSITPELHALWKRGMLYRYHIAIFCLLSQTLHSNISQNCYLYVCMM